jgi:hypothetical protein
MDTRPCARCGTPIDARDHLCARCLEELPLERPARVATVEAERTEPRPVPPPERTWRGQPVPSGMVLPSQTQYHGTMYALIALGVAVTMVLAVLVNKGVGPFAVTGTNAGIAGSGSAQVEVNALVHNIGARAGRARCVARWTDQIGGPRQSSVILTEVIAPDETASVTVPLPGLLEPPSPVTVDCK